MTTPPTVSTIPVDRTAIANMKSAERLEYLRSLIGASVAAVRQAAIVLAVMEDRGDDLSSVPTHLRNMLSRVRTDHLLPEVVTSLAGRLRQRVQFLPLLDQRRIVDGGTVEYLPGLDIEPVQIEAQHLTTAQIMQVFGDGFIRNAAEQRIYLIGQAATGDVVESAAQPRQRRKKNEVIVDKKNGGIIIGSLFFTRKELTELLAQL